MPVAEIGDGSRLLQFGTKTCLATKRWNVTAA